MKEMMTPVQAAGVCPWLLPAMNSLLVADALLMPC
jgi:hypothetical protein